MNDAFYIGYKAANPPGLTRHTRRTFLAASILLALAAGVSASFQTPADPGTFEYGISRSYEGTLLEYPLPMLRQQPADGSVSHALLVAAGKHGLPHFARGHHGEHVRFRGSLIQKGNARMIEMNDPPSFQSLAKPTEPAPTVPFTNLGEASLAGELVDTKCYFGVMRPAVGKVHRACAVRCLSGGIPPGLLIRDGQGNATVVLLTGPENAPLKVNPQWAARTLRAEGILTFRENQLYLQTRRLEQID